MIVIAGGGYSSRGNAMEGYPIAEAFQDLGYNAYVLQRRVAPTARKIPGWICSGLSGICDIMPTAWDWAVWTVSPPAASRAVRAPSWEKWPTCMANVQPTLYDADYASDAVDQMSADLDVVCPCTAPSMTESIPATTRA